MRASSCACAPGTATTSARHFGGSLFAMTDPFWMLLTMKAMGRDYYVWDKAGTIEFVKPGRGRVHAQFRLDEPTLDQLRRDAAGGGKVLRWFDTEVIDCEGDVWRGCENSSTCVVNPPIATTSDAGRHLENRRSVSGVVESLTRWAYV
jgi:hypothetical protein